MLNSMCQWHLCIFSQLEMFITVNCHERCIKGRFINVN